MRKIIIGLLGSAGLLATPAIADPQTTTTIMDVKATVDPVCSVDSGGTLDFGTITSTGSDFMPAEPGKLMVTCSKTTSFTVTADNGANAGEGTQRMMKGSAHNDFLNYTILTAATGGSSFPTNGDSSPPANAGTGASQEIDIFGKIAAGTTVPTPDSYSDQLTLTITY